MLDHLQTLGIGMEPLVTSILETTGLGVFIWYSLKGLKEQLTGLENVISAQKKTIEVMDKRIEETEKIGGIYRNLLSDLPADIDNYKTIVSKTKDAVIVELQSQHLETKKKLDEAQKQILASGSSQEQITTHLKALKNLLSKQKNQFGHSNELDLKGICEFNARTVEHCVPLILESQTLEGFLHQLGFEVEVTEDMLISRTLFTDRQLPDGTPLTSARASHSIDGGWFAIANNHIWLNQIRLGQWKDEFSMVKTTA